MRNITLTLFALLAFSFSAMAQKAGFEGTIVYSTTFSGAMADMAGPMLPNKLEAHFKGVKSRMKQSGGMTQTDVISDAAQKLAYMVFDAKKTALKIADDGTKEEPQVEVVKLEGRKQILGYNCQEYKVITNAGGTEMTAYLWIAPDINLPDSKSLRGGSGTMLALKDVQGLALETTINMSMMGQELTMEMKASEVKAAKLDEAIFTIPKGYKVEEFTPEKMQSLMMGN